MPSSVPSAPPPGTSADGTGGTGPWPEVAPTSAPQGNVLRIPVFRRMWAALGLASFGDWLGFLAFTALARELSGGSAAAANVAVSAVLIMRLAPALLLAPFAGVVADRLDRRWTMVLANVARGAIVLFVPFADSLWMLIVATLLLETASLFFIPAKEATVPNLVPRDRLESANSVNLLTTYGAAAPAAGLFILLASAQGLLNYVFGGEGTSIHITLTLWLNGLAFFASALILVPLRSISGHGGAGRQQGTPVLRAIVEGWRYIGRTPLVRALVVGMLGAFAAGGVVIGLAPTHVRALGAGDAGMGLLFALVFLGLAAGMGAGPRVVGEFSRRRLFGICLTGAGVSLTLLALIPNMVLVALLTFTLGMFAGVAWVTGYTLLGLEVTDEVRGRTFAFVQSMVRVVLLLVLASAPYIASRFGEGFTLRFGEQVNIHYTGMAITLLLAGVLAAGLGAVTYRSLDDRGAGPRPAPGAAAAAGMATDRVGAQSDGLDVEAASAATASTSGFFIALEGGEGTGKSTQAQLLADTLREAGTEVVLTREPGATPIGAHLRRLLLSEADATGISPRAEALLYAADRAEHVDKVIRPALERGAVVITDRYIDSSLAYQGAGRVLDSADIARLSAWATGRLLPHLTVVLDLPPQEGLARLNASADRLESEPVEFHERVRQEFLSRARGGASHVVIDASAPVEAVAEQVSRAVSEAMARPREHGPDQTGEPAPRTDAHDRADETTGVPLFSRVTEDGARVAVAPEDVPERSAPT